MNMRETALACKNWGVGSICVFVTFTLLSKSLLVCCDDYRIDKGVGVGGQREREREVPDTVTLHWLMYSDRLSAVRGEYCMLGRLA